MSSEIERKWIFSYNSITPLIKQLLDIDEFGDIKIQNIQQFYLKIESEQEIRCREINIDEEKKFYITEKKGKGLEREENEIQISESLYNFFIRFKIGTTVKKIRYVINTNGLKVEIDNYFSPKLNEKFIVEIEFKSINEAKEFNLLEKIPELYNFRYLDELTEKREFKNKQIALNGTFEMKREINVLP